MGNLGWTEIFFIVVFALIIFGPRKLPELAKTLGRTMAQLRRASEEFKHTWEAEVDRTDIKSVKNDLTKLSNTSVATDDDKDDSQEPNATPEPLTFEYPQINPVSEAIPQGPVSASVTAGAAVSSNNTTNPETASATQSTEPSKDEHPVSIA